MFTQNDFLPQKLLGNEGCMGRGGGRLYFYCDGFIRQIPFEVRGRVSLGFIGHGLKYYEFI